jgi:Bardet-Biedl syndrome 9 protein
VYSWRPRGVDTSDDAAIAAALQLQADAEQKALRARQAASELAAAGLSSGRSKEAAEAAEAAAAEAAIAAVEAATKRDDRAAASGVVRFSGLGDVDATGRRLTRAEKDAITGGSGAGAGSRVAVRLAWSARAVAGAGGRGASGPERGGAGAVALEVGRFAGLRGLVASLDEAGGVRVSYLGTSPPSDAVGAFAEGKALDYDSMDAEHRALLAEIRRSQTAGGGGGGGVSEPRDRLVLRAQVPTLVALADPGDEADDGGGGRGGPRGGAEDEPSSPAGGADGRVVQVAVRLYVSYTGSQPLRDVSLAISAPHGVLTVPASRSVVLSRVKGGGADPVVVPLLFRHAKDAAPTSTTVRVCAAFASAGGGEPRTAECAFRLPLCLFCRAAPPIKSSAFKITLDASCVSGGSGNGRTAPIPAIDALFADMLQQPDLDEDARRRCARSAGSVLTLVLRNGVDCTVLGSKSKGGRFRVQSSRLDGLLLVASELIRRLEDGGGDGIEVRYSDPLPLADFFAHVDEHFAARAALAEQRTALEDRAHQLRVIQKRMLLRFKDKNSPPLNGLDVLLDGTLQQLVAMGREMEGTQRRLASKARQLSATTRLLQLLTKHRFGLTDAEADVFASVVSADVDDNAEQGWEERTDAAVTHCLRTTLAKVAKETTGAAPPPLAPLKKTSKFKKHITILCDRLRKGAKLIPPPKPKTKKKALPEL